VKRGMSFVQASKKKKKKKKKRIQRKQEEGNENWKQIKRRWIIAQDCV
jgi:hypothetical protein